MLVSWLIGLVLLQGSPSLPACPEFEVASSSLPERRAALDACAAAANQKPIDFFLDLVSKLAPHDSRTDRYGAVAAGWSAEELSQEHICARLLAILDEKGSSASARVVALRALHALPPEKRPPSARVIDQFSIEITAVPAQMSYDIKAFTVSPGALVHLTLHNPDGLEHNLLVVAPGSLAEMGTAGDRMGQVPDGRAKEFVPDSAKVLSVMGLVAPGKSSSMWFVAPLTPGTYPYVCTYPAHWRTMNGKMKVAAPAAAAAQ